MSPIPEMNSSKGSNSLLQNTMQTRNEGTTSFYKNTNQTWKEDERKITGTGQYNLDKFENMGPEEDDYSDDFESVSSKLKRANRIFRRTTRLK